MLPDRWDSELPPRANPPLPPSQRPLSSGVPDVRERPRAAPDRMSEKRVEEAPAELSAKVRPPPAPPSRLAPARRARPTGRPLPAAPTARPTEVRTVGTLGADPARSGEGPPEFVTAALGVVSAETTRRDAEATLAWLGDEGVPFARGVRYVAVYSDYDELTGPVVAPEVPGFVDLRVVRLQDGCEADRSGHLTVLASPRALDLVEDALAAPGAGEARPARCVPSDQVVGVLAPVPPR